MTGSSILGLLRTAVVVGAVLRMAPFGSRYRDEAVDILDWRFATGEMDVEAYRAALH